jgi:hypothetical protein
MNVVGGLLCVFGQDIEVSVFGERSGVDQFVFRKPQTAPPVFVNESIVGKWVLRIFVERFEVRMGWGGIEVVITFLTIFAVIPLRASESEQALF